ncbi:uncharacterized protein LOC141851833 [Brevipalpus obovatus]|uniref:uncharacterized protein LOC141851833 n=1 Tax=Brevipalpus obovatus TaxID=246614 RepID=UPI003D9E9848
MGCGVSKSSSIGTRSDISNYSNKLNKSVKIGHHTSNSNTNSFQKVHPNSKESPARNKSANRSNSSSRNSLIHTSKRNTSKIGFFRSQLSRIEESPSDEKITQSLENKSIAIQVESPSSDQSVQTDQSAYQSDLESNRSPLEMTKDTTLGISNNTSNLLPPITAHILDDLGIISETFNFNEIPIKVSRKSSNTSDNSENYLLQSDVCTSSHDTKTAQVAIQVIPNRKTRSTQTEYGIHHDGKIGVDCNQNDIIISNSEFRKASINSESPTHLWQKYTEEWANESKEIKLNADDNQMVPVPCGNCASQGSIKSDQLNDILPNDNNHINDISTYRDLGLPFSHIEKQFFGDEEGKNSTDNTSKSTKSLNRLLDDIENCIGQTKEIAKKNMSTQTDLDPITDESPEYAARPPPFRKKEMIPSIMMFNEVDKRACEVPEDVGKSLKSLVEYLCQNCINDLYRVRAIFRWIAENIRFNWNCMGMENISEDILESHEGVSKDYSQLFGDMCAIAHIRQKRIQGFIKGYDYRPGHRFKPGEDFAHHWNAVFILGSWHLVDPSLATGYTDHSGQFQRKLDEHFFLTDPEALIWTHFPYDPDQGGFSKWQLLEKPITLREFNALPKVTPYFFEYNLKIRSEVANPIEFKIQKEIKIGAHETMRYKFKFYPADQVENASLNSYVFCQLREDRSVGSFLVSPPCEDQYFLKIYACPEKDMSEQLLDSRSTIRILQPQTSNSSSTTKSQSNLHSCATFLLKCIKARRYNPAYPLNDLPWGPTQAFYDYKMRMINQTGPIITTWGGRRRLILECAENMLITHQVIDSEGLEMDAKHLLTREDIENRITFNISPPRVGMFKIMVFGMPKPKQKGKWRLPLLGTFLIECKMAKIIKCPPDEEDPPPIVVNAGSRDLVYDHSQFHAQQAIHNQSIIR